MDKGHCKILVVEDDPDLMRIISYALTGAGYEVVRAYGGEDALRKVENHRLDLILTDLAMPKMSGVEVIDAVKNNPDTKGIPVVAVTAYIWDGIAQSAGQVGCDGFIAKPFDRKHLLQEVEKYLHPDSEGEEEES